MTARGLRLHVREWLTGDDDGPRPTLLCLHGWMDVSASFQFMVDALEGSWRVLAPDWRGYGLSDAAAGGLATIDSYAFVDYLADLDALIGQCLAGDEPVRLIGHSMGGNVATLYAGVRPERIAGLVNLDGAGMPPSDPAGAAARYRRWLDELQTPMPLRDYASLEAVAARLMANNRRLTADRARFLAQHWARREGERYVLQADPAHRRINPVLYRVDEALSCWRAITAPVLWVVAGEPGPFHQFTRTEEYRARQESIPHRVEVTVADSGHKVQHDQPARGAGLVEE